MKFLLYIMLQLQLNFSSRACRVVGQTAFGVVKYGLGTTLCNAARTMCLGQFCIFLVEWRKDLREVLRTDLQHLIGRRNPACANNVTDAFPDPDVVHSYLYPLTSPSRAGPLPSIQVDLLPDLARIVELCERYFEWATPSEILPKFLKHVWPGVVLWLVREDIIAGDGMHEEHSPRVCYKCIRVNHV
jgi:Holliday junction resolvase YEN1